MVQKAVSYLAAGALIMGMGFCPIAKAEDRVDRNLRIMLEAARKLTLSPASDGHAYLLVKRETIRSPVAIIFGYVDNAAACEELASVLSNAPLAGTFECNPVF